MIPTSVHGHMPFVKDNKTGNKNSTLSLQKFTVDGKLIKSMESNVRLVGSLSRKKVLRIGPDQRLDKIPDNIKKDILTKDSTWYAVVRALFRKGSRKKDNNQERASRDLRGHTSDDITFSSAINEAPIKGSTTMYPSMKLSELSRSKSLRLEAIEEEADYGSTISISFRNCDPISLTYMVDSSASTPKLLSLSDQLRRRATSSLVKTHEEAASISSSSSSISGNSNESLVTL